MTRTSIFCATLGALALATVLAGGCSDDTGGTAPTPSACSDPTRLSLPTCSVAGQDPFSDEACQGLDDYVSRSTPAADDARAPAIMTPSEGERVPAATPYTFRWSAPMAFAPRRRPPTFRDEFARWTTLVPEAEAHCQPFNGRAYELTFRAGGQTLMRRQQSATSWTPDTGAWARIVTGANGRPVELTVVTATLTNNRVGTGSAYVQTAPRRFTLSM